MAVTVPVSFLVSSWMIHNNFRKNFQFIVMVVLFGNLLWINSTIIKGVPLRPKTEIVKWLEAQPGLFRVYSPSYSFQMPNILQQANGVDPMHLGKYADYLRAASGIITNSYSVSVPEIYVDENTPELIRNLSRYPDTKLLGWLNVRYLAAKYELKSENLKFITQYGLDYLYENLDYNERVWYESGNAEIVTWSPNKILIHTNGEEGRLVISEIGYPGWIAYVDGLRRSD